MKRRAFALGLPAMLGAMAMPLRAQVSGRKYRIGALLGGGKDAMQTYRAALAERLGSHGFVEGRNLEIVARGATAIFHEDRNTVRELVALKPDALLTCLTRVTQAAQAATKSVPIVFTWVGDPVLAGIVKHNARPGGNATGVASRFVEVAVKRVELVRELLPEARRVGIPGVSPEDPFYRAASAPMREAASKLGIELIETPRLMGWVATLDAAVKAGAQALLPFINYVATGALMSADQVIEYTTRQRIAIVLTESEMVQRGGLISYGVNLLDDIRRAADMLAQVLKGADPAVLPVDQAVRFELAVNLKTAAAIGVKVPSSILLRADRIIQ
jgi:putative tryptophan/tyrosine transport system substrate-binding protein